MNFFKKTCKIIGLIAIFAIVFSLSAWAGTVNRDPYGRAMPRLYDYDSGSVGSYYLDFPTLSANDTFCGLTTTQTLANKTLTAPTITNPTVTTGQFIDPNLSSATITNPTVTTGTFTDPNISSATITTSNITNPTVNTGQFTDPNLSSATITGSTIKSSTFHDPNIVNIPTFAQTGKIKFFTYQEDSLADDANVPLPDATDGMCLVSCTDPNTPGTAESGYYMVVSDGSVTKIAGSTNAVSTNTDAKLCCYHDPNSASNGTAGIVSNRLGCTGTIRILYFYQ